MKSLVRVVGRVRDGDCGEYHIKANIILLGSLGELRVLGELRL